MRSNFLIVLLVGIFLVGFISAEEEVANFTYNSDYSGIQVIQLMYEPYPVNPGEYFDLWVKVYTGAGTKNTTFKLTPSYPFSLDSGESAIQSLGTNVQSKEAVLQYKVRVSKDAVEGVNELKMLYSADGDNIYEFEKVFEISVADAQTDFDLVVQESSGTDVSIAIANTGKNTANSLIVRIPDQENYAASGTNGQMVGNLDSGDYTIVSFSLTAIGKGSSSNTLEIQLDYTDSIGERRSVMKELNFGSSIVSVGNSTAAATGNFPRGNFTNQQSTSVFNSYWLWAVIILVVAVFGIYYYKRHKQGKGLFSDSKLKKSGSDSKGTPEWVSAERVKRK